VCKRRLDDRIESLIGVKPLQERLHFIFESSGGRRFKMNLLAAFRSGNDLRRARLFGAPSSNNDLENAAAPGGEERGVPNSRSAVTVAFARRPSAALQGYSVMFVHDRCRHSSAGSRAHTGPH